MQVLEKKLEATRLKEVKQESADLLIDFDENSLRNLLIKSAGDQLTMVADSIGTSIDAQLEMIRKSSVDFSEIIKQMDDVQTNVSKNVEAINKNVDHVMQDTRESSGELNHVSSNMRSLEEHFASIDKLLETVNDIADQTNLLSLNATIEAARAGESARVLLSSPMKSRNCQQPPRELTSKYKIL